MRTRILMFGWEFPPFNSGGLGVACSGLTHALSDMGVEVIFVMPKKMDITTSWAKMVYADSVGAPLPRRVGMPGIPGTSRVRALIEGRAINSLLSPYLTTSRYARVRKGLSGREIGNEHGEEGDNPPLQYADLSMYGSDLFGEVVRYAAMGGTVASVEDFDVIYAHDWLSFGAGIEAKRQTGKPLIVHVHATEFDRCGGDSGINSDVYEIEKEGMQEADVVIAVSELTKNIIVQKYGIPEWKVRVVYNGIDDSMLPVGGEGLPRLRKLKAAGFKLVLFLGRVTLQKGPDYFIRAARLVLQHNPNVYFILSGSGDMEAEIMQLAARLGIGDRLFFTGFLNGAEKHEVYSNADLFVMPSVSEPFGIAPLEAMKLGTPVLISKQSGVAEVVKHALKVDFWDVDEMANKILSVVGLPGISQVLAENAMREAEALTWSQAAQKIGGILKELTHTV